jgi:DNA helicase-2/ATP-dependent DNA helicase PcrA
MESGLGLTFSQEQKQILMNDFEKPLLVNACAGAGKTTIVILMILVAISKGLVDSSEILGVTFSNRSRLDMDERYNKYIKDLSDVGLNLLDTRPLFSTFHSLFLHLLMTTKKFENIQVLQNYTFFTRQLKNKINHPSDFLSKSEMLEQMFDLNDYMINQGLTDGCLYPIGYRKMTKTEIIAAFRQNAQHEFDDGFYQDYLQVIDYYQELKFQNSLVDFNDMKLLLLQSMKEEKYLEHYRSIMYHFKLVVIDEFQDIDNLQWQIISQLLDTETLNRLVGVGDDDQSVYAFRGSNPKYIMNYQKLMPKSVILNLSTNYRTGSKILNCAIPSITKNSVRLNKSLKSFNSGKGTVYSYHSSKTQDSEGILLEHLAQQVKNPNINSKEIVVLVRYNAARTLAADWLANKDIYANLNNNKLVLQHNRNYKIIVELMHALWDDKFKYFYAHSNKIGFKEYTNHIDELKKRYDKKRIINLSKYLVLAEDSLNSLLKDGSDEYEESCDINIIQKFRKIQKLKNNGENASALLELYSTVIRLTENYFNFMISQNFISKEDLFKLLDYLENEIEDTKSPQEFFYNEDRKRSILTKSEKRKQQKFQIQFLSLHQSKGLEFEYVYLLGLTDKRVRQGSVIINEIYRPDLTLESFIEIFSKQISLNYKMVKGYYTSAMIDEFEDLMRDKHFNSKNVAASLTNNHVSQLMIELYKATKKYSAFIEEERRLLYVGVTRAKNELNVEIPDSANPLLKELILPK